MPMHIALAADPIAALPEYARVSIAFTVDRVFDVAGDAGSARGVVLTERALDVPYEKDYDAIDGEGPLAWPRHFDLSTWAIITARDESGIVGAAAARRDAATAALWDIRVAPHARRQALGSTLFEEVEAWARLNRCRRLEVETQNTNVHACRFYQRQGCRLGVVDRAAYPSLPNEIKLLWYKDLA